MYPAVETEQVRQILTAAKTVAVIGVSSKPDRASHQVAAYLIEQTHFDVYLINPAFDGEILGQRVYKSLSELPMIPDIVDVFRKSEDMPAVWEKESPALLPNCAEKTWWMQLGIKNDDVARVAHDVGMNIVMDRCIKVDYMLLMH